MAERTDPDFFTPKHASVKVFRQTKDVPLPQKKSDGASGFDLSALIDKPIRLEPLTPTYIPTGLHLAIPLGFEGQVRPRSNMNRKGILVGWGTLDSDYRGEVGVTLVNCTKADYEILPGDRIAQLVISTVADVSYDEVEVLDALGTTSRGSAGFGSTGR